MELRDLISASEAPMLMGADNVDITNIQPDSRRVTKGSLFVAVRGTAVNGHTYMDSVIEKGATAIVCEEAPSYLGGRCLFIVVKDSVEVLGLLVPRWYGDSFGELVLAGVTGTNGKTTIVISLCEMFRKMGYKVGLLSTICNYIDGEAVPTDHTAPDPLTLHSLMARMVEAGREYAFMEVNSHLIDQRCISGSSFDGGIFTNLTRDHPDYHKTVENYLKAKKKFFDDLPTGTLVLTSADDKSGLVMLQNTKAKKLTYSLRTLADFKGKILESYFEGTDLIISGREIMVHFVGCFNAYNLLAVHGAAVSLEKDPEGVLIVLSTLRSVFGCFEMIRSPLGYTAIVNYAHIPDASTNILNGIHEVSDGKRRITTVVGAEGNRDKGKRLLMVKETIKLSNQVILTPGNPCSEEPDDITNDVVAGSTKMDMERALCVTSRTRAIKTATMLAREGDMILVAGKGHEDCQKTKGVKHHSDDREKLREIFSTQQS